MHRFQRFCIIKQEFSDSDRLCELLDNVSDNTWQNLLGYTSHHEDRLRPLNLPSKWACTCFPSHLHDWRRSNSSCIVVTISVGFNTGTLDLGHLKPRLHMSILTSKISSRLSSGHASDVRDSRHDNVRQSGVAAGQWLY